MIPRHYFLLLALLCAPAWTGCANRPPTLDERLNAGIVPPPVGLDTSKVEILHFAPDSITVTPHQSLLDRLRGKAPVPYRAPAGTAIRTGKKATVNVYNAPATITTIGKKATAATGAGAKVAVAGKNSTQATDSAQAVATGGGAAALGTGASASGGATTTKPGLWAVMGAAALRLWWLWLLIAAFLFRKSLPVVGKFFL